MDAGGGGGGRRMQETPAAKPAPAQELERPADWIVRHDERLRRRRATGERPDPLFRQDATRVGTSRPGPGRFSITRQKKAAGPLSRRGGDLPVSGQERRRHGLFYGGQRLDDEAGGPTYWAWLLSRDGTLKNAPSVKGKYSGGSKGERHPAVVPSSPDKPVKNVLAIESGWDTGAASRQRPAGCVTTNASPRRIVGRHGGPARGRRT